MMQEIVLDAENRDINQEKIRNLKFKLFEKPPIPYKKKTEYNLRLVEQDMSNRNSIQTSAS
jgi:hypothetical protein